MSKSSATLAGALAALAPRIEELVDARAAVGLPTPAQVESLRTLRGELGRFRELFDRKIAELEDGLLRGKYVSAADLAQQFGTDALPLLMRVAENTDSGLASVALQAIGRLGEEARPALPLLISSLGNADIQIRDGATSGLLLLGRVAFPYLRDQLGSHDALLQAGIAHLLAEGDREDLNLIAADLRHPDPLRRIGAAITFRNVQEPRRKLGGPPRGFDIDPFKWLATYYDYRLATRGGAVRNPAVGLMAATLDPDPEVRFHAVEACGALLPALRSPVDVVRVALADPQPRVRMIAAMVLRNDKNPSRGTVGAVTEVLGDSDVDVRVSAAGTLGSWGKKASSAASALTRLAAEGPEGVRLAALRALKAMGTETPAIVTTLVAIANNTGESKLVRYEVIPLLTPHARKYPHCLSALGELLADPDLVTAYVAAEEIGKLGPDALPMLGELMVAAGSAREKLRSTALQSLGKLGPAARECIPLLNEGLKDPRFRKEAAESIGSFGVEGVCAVPHLLAWLAEPRVGGSGRSSAIRALGKVGGGQPGVVSALTGELAAPSSGEREAAIEALGDLGAEGVVAVPEITAASQDPEYCEASLAALGKIGASREGMLKALLALDGPKGPRCGKAWFEALVRLGETPPDFAPILAKLLEATRSVERLFGAPQPQSVELIEHIGRMGTTARAATSAIIPFLCSGDMRERIAAAEALAKIGEGTEEVLNELVAMRRRTMWYREDSKAAKRALQVLRANPS